jgi:hypothetical protein
MVDLKRILIFALLSVIIAAILCGWGEIQRTG